MKEDKNKNGAVLASMGKTRQFLISTLTSVVRSLWRHTDNSKRRHTAFRMNCQNPFTRYNRSSNRSNIRLHRVNKHSTVVQPAVQPADNRLYRVNEVSQQEYDQLEMWANANVMAALPDIGGALCSMPQSLADAHYLTAAQ